MNGKSFIMNKESNMPTDPELVLEYIDQLKADNKKLKEELKERKKPILSLNADHLGRAFDHWTWAMLVLVGCACAIISTISYIWPSVYETGRFYLDHSVVDYNPPAACADIISRGRICRLPRGDAGSCYVVVKEIENGFDDDVTICIRDKDEAYKTANEFADEWKKLKEKEETDD